ncbi:aminoglycoside phosphotransferase family protein [Chengkuizengella axinellae]|uniref:Aminoglycoside phosphotransferase family protein n=1 Tax=Chengkuizengella axinellae TaxID=3064388 RepID=A0ABT9J6P0_9BACL|nr:aminoglycoside phosphotransferase family protein [Chengkuizengella sp. 2205SS18-9]MDP5277112.1 aminoglycoside phosphotransferase family protein [Chengkuizengella sp. 2205SS18-9]
MSTIKTETLTQVLSKIFGTKIICVDFQAKQLQGGTVGEVQLVTCNAKTTDGEKFPYKIVSKTQKKWERYSDPDSWRREYDFYKSNFGAVFSESFRWPECYHIEMNEKENETQIWMEYIDGISGLDLTGDMYEKAALELGRLQGKLYAEQPAVLKSLTNLSHPDLMKNMYLHYRSWPVVYDYIRSEDCELPLHVRQMLIDIDEQADEIFARIGKLPLVLCHRDFWVTNLIYADGNFALIDWDTSGWGYLGEDLASLIADESDINNMVEHYQRCIPAYYKGFSEYTDVSRIADHCVYEIILLVFGYRIVEGYLHTEDDDEKTKLVHTLQKIYEMKTIPLMV